MLNTVKNRIISLIMASHLLQLIRAHQWYKNLVVFLAIFFSGNLLEGSELYKIFWALVALCFISSANYIINDLVDIADNNLLPIYFFQFYLWRSVARNKRK